MSKIKTEVKLSKILTILHSVQSENEDLKEEISELKKILLNQKPLATKNNSLHH